MRYHVFHENKKYTRDLEANSSFEARKALAGACRKPVTEFFAIRHDLMGPRDWDMYEAAQAAKLARK